MKVITLNLYLGSMRTVVNKVNNERIQANKWFAGLQSAAKFLATCRRWIIEEADIIRQYLEAHTTKDSPDLWSLKYHPCPVQNWWMMTHVSKLVVLCAFWPSSILISLQIFSLGEILGVASLIILVFYIFGISWKLFKIHRGTYVEEEPVFYKYK